MDGGAWWAAVHGFAKSQTRLSNFTFTFHFHALEKEMATHSSVLAWRIPGMGEPGGLPSMGLHGVGHDWSELAAARLVITLLPRSTHLLISWLQSPSTVLLEPQKIKSATVLTVFPYIFHEVMGPGAMIFVLSNYLLGTGLSMEASYMTLVVKNPPANGGDIRDADSIPGSGRSPGGGHGNPLQHSYLENPMDCGAWWVTDHGVTKFDTIEVTLHAHRLSI